MTTHSLYRDNPQRVASLVRSGEVHRDLYTSQEIFELEIEHLFANTWTYIGHASQLPKPGDFITTELAGEPVVAVRHGKDAIRVLYNRCPHKGVKIASEACGNVGRFFRCPYHAWSFRTDGSLLAVPLNKGYQDTGFDESIAKKGMTPVKHVKLYRDFIFAKASDYGDDFETFFGDALSTIDNMIDRSPEGRLEVVGLPHRYLHHCNWKMPVENLTDTCHPMVAHEASAGTAIRVWDKVKGDKTKKPMAVEVYEPFMSPYEFFETMGIRSWPNGHGHTGVTQSIHSNYSAIPGYFESMVDTYGEKRAKAILDENRHNTLYFPNMTVKGPVQTLRVFRPLAADRTLIESYTFRLVGAPDRLLELTCMYNRLINAATSIVGHDDLEMYERAQEGLVANANPWVNFQRLQKAEEPMDETAVENGTTERQMRNQNQAWLKYMMLSLGDKTRKGPETRKGPVTGNRAKAESVRMVS